MDKSLRYVYLFLFLCSLIAKPFTLDAADFKKILILHSYHQGFDWTDSITKGVQSVLEKSDLRYELYFEHMDVKRHKAAEVYPYLEELFRYRYINVRFDVIILSDDFALDFVIERRNKLFPSVPIVFCGINNYEPNKFEGVKNITGVAEDVDFKGTIDLALKLHPETKNVAFISDGTPSGMQMLKRTRNVMKQFGEKLNLIELFDFAIVDLKQRLKQLPQNTVVIHTHYYNDKGSGRKLTVDQSFAIVRQNCTLPIYTGWDFQIGYGAIGGVVTNGVVQGSLAAKMAVRILNGEATETIPVVAQSPNTPMFDYQYLKPFGITLSALPKGRFVINEPVSFYYRNKTLVWQTAGFIFSLCLIILFLIINIGRRRRAEEALRMSEQRYRTLFENSGDPIYINTREGRFVDVNQSFLDLFGYAREELADLTTEDIYADPENRPKVLKEIDQKGYLRDYEDLYKKKDGTKIECLLTATLRRAGDGSIIGSEGVIRDISEKKHLEAQLRQSQKMEGIGTLAGGIAHEFNNILGIIIGNTELAIDDVPEWNPAKECLKEIRAASMRAKDVVRHILSFARKTPAQRQPIQISTIIRDSLKLMRASIPTTIEIRQNLSCESEIILADPTEINQILMNLCTNSLYALSEETGELEVTLESINLDEDSASLYDNLETGNFVKLTVKDTGEGIDPKIMDRIFDPYFTTGSLAERTGMGLAIVYGIVKKHDGAIKASSELGKGTVFEVLFPLIEETVQPELEEEPEALPTGTERILFVDDEVSLGKMAKQMLERLGYQVVTKTNPKEALALFKSEPDQFDMVITDMAMPQMAGDRLAQELMKIRKDIPVILCTGHSARIDETRAKELGLAAYVMKPLVTRDFTNTVRKVLDEAKGATQD